VEDVRFDRVGVFTYSAEEGTPAFGFAEPVPARVMRARRDRIMEAQQPISLENNRKWIGKALDVLIETVKDGVATGRSFRDAPEIDGEVIIALDAPSEAFDALRPGMIVGARVTAAEAYDLRAIIL
jgi:ribosomal protein S12 methylthiotransferase